MPYWHWLIGILVAAPHRVNAAGELCLSTHEAECLRAAEFPTAVAGLWRVPPLPPYLIRQYPQFTRFAEVQAPVSPASVVVPPSSRPLSVTPGSMVEPSRVGVALETRLRHWLGHTATADQRRILQSLVRTAAPVSKRRLQHRLHRLPAARLNPALAALVATGVLVADATGLVLSAEVQARLVEAGVQGVGRSTSRRAQASQGQGQRLRARGRRPWGIPLTVNGRRVLPPRGTAAWGRSLLARRGGLAVQRRYRATGRHPTAPATRARLAKRQRQQQVAAVPPSPVVTPSGASPLIEAAALASSGSPTAARLAAAWAAQQPIGRRARLEEERWRR